MKMFHSKAKCSTSEPTLYEGVNCGIYGLKFWTQQECVVRAITCRFLLAELYTEIIQKLFDKRKMGVTCQQKVTSTSPRFCGFETIG